MQSLSQARISKGHQAENPVGGQVLALLVPGFPASSGECALPAIARFPGAHQWRPRGWTYPTQAQMTSYKLPCYCILKSKCGKQSSNL